MSQKDKKKFKILESTAQGKDVEIQLTDDLLKLIEEAICMLMTLKVEEMMFEKSKT